MRKMEDGILPPEIMLAGQSDSAMDFDFVDQLLLDGCWLATSVGSDLLNLNPSNSPALFDSSFLLPLPDTNNVEVTTRPWNKDTREVEVGSFSLGNLLLKELPGRSPRNSLLPGEQLAGENDVGESSEVDRRWWIGPQEMPGSGSSVMERLMTVIWHIKQSVKQKDVLIQVWVPENRGGRCVLRTHEDLFALDPSSWRLANYREVSTNYRFSAEEDSKDFVGLPGRVFLGKVPEWTPDVRFFRSDEYQRVDHAQKLDVSGTLALPVFERGSRICLGVIELVTTEQKIKYRPELENVCRALEAVGLQSSEDPSMKNMKGGNVSYEAALPEIQELLRSACETHKLPLAQTWVPCIRQGKGGCRHSDDNYIHCVSTVDHACHIAHPNIRPFHEACSEHHLLKGQGIVGEAFLTNQPCFSSDITSYTKTEYPLAHHAKVFNLCAAVAIRLRSLHTGKVDFVLEFFLPVDCRDPKEQKKMLTSLSIVIQQVCRTLRVVTDKELAEESGFSTTKLKGKNVVEDSCRRKHREVQTENIVPLGQPAAPELLSGIKYIQCKIDEKESPLEDGQGGNSTSIAGDYPVVHGDKTVEKTLSKAEKTISLEVLQQYFSGSLKDAAKSIGVCPTTLKRICRRHGIQRWPSRKIKKVGHSLQKIQHVIDSIQGASGAVQIGSFCKNFPELASPSILRISRLSTSEQTDLPNPLTEKESTFSAQVTPLKSPSSSCSQSSSSSHSCSSETLQHHSAFTYSANVDTMQSEFRGSGVLKRARSNSELHSFSQEQKKQMPRTESHKSLNEQPNLENLAPLPENGSHVPHISQEIDLHRVKVTYGSEKIRFRMTKSWRFRDLLQEISRRFNISNTNGVHMKYLDDDLEWVLLTCDDDLQECINIHQSSKGQTMRLMLQTSTNGWETSSGRKSPLDQF